MEFIRSTRQHVKEGVLPDFFKAMFTPSPYSMPGEVWVLPLTPTLDISRLCRWAKMMCPPDPP